MSFVPSAVFCALLLRAAMGAFPKTFLFRILKTCWAKFMKPAAKWEKKTCSDLHLCTGFRFRWCLLSKKQLCWICAGVPTSLWQMWYVLVYECHVRRLNEKKKKKKTRQKNVYFIPVKDRKSNSWKKKKVEENCLLFRFFVYFSCWNKVFLARVSGLCTLCMTATSKKVDISLISNGKIRKSLKGWRCSIWRLMWTTNHVLYFYSNIDIYTINPYRL